MKEGKDHISDADPEDEALDQLLGSAKTPAVSPYFSRRVLRETAAVKQRQFSLAGLLSPLRRGFGWNVQLPRAVWSGALAAALLCAVSLNLTPKSPRIPDLRRGAPAPAPVAAAAEEISSQDVDVIANLDDLMSTEESTLWTEENNAL